MYNDGYAGKFYGSPVMVMPQRHKIGSTDFVFDDNVITIIAGEDRPVKFISEGNGTIIMGQPTDNQDLTQNLNYVSAA